MTLRIHLDAIDYTLLSLLSRSQNISHCLRFLNFKYQVWTLLHLGSPLVPHSTAFRSLKTRAKPTLSKMRSNTKSSKPIKLVIQSSAKQKHALGVFMPHRSKDPLSFVSRCTNPSTLVSALITEVRHKLAEPLSLNTSRINSKKNLFIVLSILSKMSNVNSVSKLPIPKLSPPKNTQTR